MTPIVPAVALSARSAASLRTEDVRRGRAAGVPRSAPELARAIVAIGSQDGADLRPGDLVHVAVLGGDDTDWSSLGQLLAAPPGTRTGPPRLDGTVELDVREHPLLALLHEACRPAPGDERALVKPLVVPVPGRETPLDLLQLVVYFQPSEHRGVRLHGLPPLTVMVSRCPDEGSLAALERFLDVHHRGRGRVFQEEYLATADPVTGLPASWSDDVLRDAVELVLDPPTPLELAGRGSADAVGRLFAATVATTHRLGRQQLELEQRLGGASWKADIHHADLAVATSSLPEGQRDRVHYALFSPCGHYVSQIGECAARVRELNERAREYFAVVSALADRTLVERTEGARRAAIVVGVLTATLAVAGVYAALSAIPLPAERGITPTARAVALVGAIVVGAALCGMLVASLALRRHPTDLPPVVTRLVERTAPTSLARSHLFETLMATGALVAFVVAGLTSYAAVLAVAATLSAATLASWLLRHGD